MNALIDTHAHLCSPEFGRDLKEVLLRAQDAGVEAVVAVGETLDDAVETLDLAAQFPIIRPAAGLYPTILDIGQAGQVRDFIRLHCSRLAAIGEVGLDHWMVKEEKEREVQHDIFTGFIRLSKELGLPLNVHSRSAGRDTVGCLLDLGAKRVQMHAFDGKASTAMQAVEAGYFFSIPPSVVRSRQKQKLVKQLPLHSLLVETDSPVLGPDPAMRNEPANLVVSVKAIAGIKAISEQEVREAVGANTQALYGGDSK